MTLAWYVVILIALIGSLATASTTAPACVAYDGAPAYQRLICGSAVLTEMERKYSDLHNQLENGWHINILPSDEIWRGTLTACQSDLCLETAYRRRLSALDALPAFACAGKLNPAERAVCRVPALGRLDRELNLEYGRALGSSYTLLALRADQGRWRLAVRDPCGAAVACLGRAYRARVAALQ